MGGSLPTSTRLQLPDDRVVVKGVHVREAHPLHGGEGAEQGMGKRAWQGLQRCHVEFGPAGAVAREGAAQCLKAWQVGRHGEVGRADDAALENTRFEPPQSARTCLFRNPLGPLLRQPVERCQHGPVDGFDVRQMLRRRPARHLGLRREQPVGRAAFKERVRIVVEGENGLVVVGSGHGTGAAFVPQPAESANGSREGVESSARSCVFKPPYTPTVMSERYPYTMRDLGRFWTFANALSLFRLVVVLPIAVLLWHGTGLRWVLALVVLGILTDFFDGRVARWSGTVSEWGKVLDPFADKFAALVIGSVLALRPVSPNLPLWLMALVVVRDICVFVGGVLLAKRHGTVPPSVWSGKVAVGLLAFTVLLVVLRADAPVLDVFVGVTAFFFVISLVPYGFRLAYGLRRPAPVSAQEEAP